MSKMLPGTADVLTHADRERIAIIYADVLDAMAGEAVEREAKVEILMSLLRDSETRRLDSFVSRERALAAVLRARPRAA